MTDEWKMKMWYIHKKWNITSHKNENLPFATTCYGPGEYYV